MPHREKLYSPDMVFDVQVNEVENGLDIPHRQLGIDRAPCGWSWPSTRAARRANEAFMLEGNDGGGVVVKGQHAGRIKGREQYFGRPPAAEHNYTAGKEGQHGPDGRLLYRLPDRIQHL